MLPYLRKPLVALLGLASLPLLAQDADADFPAVSGENCTFLADRDAFLRWDLRSRQAIQAKLTAIDTTRAAAAAPAGTTAAIPRRNFIDVEIFDRLDQARVSPAPLSSDEEFFRRVHLDVTGRIPSPADVRDFVADRDPNKRSTVIGKLLASDSYVDKWTMWFGDLVENNAASVNLNNRGLNARNAFHGFLRKQVRGDESVHDIVYLILSASGNTYDDSSPANFILNGNAPGGPLQDTYDMLLYKSAKTFLGLGHYDCLLCHSGRGHLDALSLWGRNTTRAEAEGMAAFFSRTQFPNYVVPATATPEERAFYNGARVVGDNLTGSYALPTTFGNRPNRPLATGGLRSMAPRYRDGQAPASPNWRHEFATMLVNDPLFSINFVNRVWKEMFNLGLVDAVEALDPDRLDPASQPEPGWDLQATHPALLRRLANEFTARNYNLRELIRMIAESSAYQLSSRYTGDWREEYIPLFARHYPRRLAGEEIHDSIVQATGVVPRYTVTGWAEPVSWAMQLPDTSEPRSNGGANSFMNFFLRGNRDNVPRSQGSTILQASALMNDNFIRDRIHMNQSPKLREVAALPTPEAQVEELFLTFLGRSPSILERTRALAPLTAATTTAARNAALEDLVWAMINKLEFQFSY